MSWINWLEIRFGRFALPGLMRYVAALNALVFILYKLHPETFARLDFNPELILHGQVWRLVTYIFIPSITNLIPAPDWFNAAMYILMLIWIGDGLDHAWGPFKLNLFYLLGMIGTTIAGFFFGVSFSNLILNASVFFAYARFFPDLVIYMFYVLPMKVKWIAWGTAIWLLLTLGPRGPAAWAGLVVALINYFIFFGRELVHEARERQRVVVRRAKFERAIREGAPETMHSCKVCGRTEQIEPYLQFRVAADGEEYCVDHLPNPPVKN
jgi:hypothetical protein